MDFAHAVMAHPGAGLCGWETWSKRSYRSLACTVGIRSAERPGLLPVPACVIGGGGGQRIFRASQPWRSTVAEARYSSAMGLDPGSRVLMGVAGWIIAFVGTWGAIHNNGQVIRFAGGASWMSPAMRRLWAIVLVVFGVSLIVASIAA